MLSAPCFLILQMSCSKNEFQTSVWQPSYTDKFPSLTYNHFKEGVLFSNVEFGLGLLWAASFKNGRPYKENLGYFVPGGLLILPNKDNTVKSSRLTTLPSQIKDNKLVVLFEGNYLPVLGIIHTHPDLYCLRMPAPKNDFQFGYLGIHNYILGYLDLFDAYKDSMGNEIFTVLGPGNAYQKIPFTAIKNEEKVNTLAMGNNLSH